MLADERSRLLLPFGKLHAAMSSEIERRLKRRNTRSLENLVAAAQTATRTNVWWAAYRVAPEVLNTAALILAQRENKKRKKAKKSP